MRLFTFCLLLSLGLWQCSSKEAPEQSATDTSTNTETAPPPSGTQAQAVATQPYPSISSEEMKYLWDNCDYVDFVMYSTNFSMSQSEQAAIRSTLAGISTTPAQVFPECRPLGRIFFQVDGENAAEADIFFGGNCMYYLFLKDGTYSMGNQFTQQGVNFYQKILTQVSTQSSGQ